MYILTCKTYVILKKYTSLVMNSYHKEILNKIQDAPKDKEKHPQNDKYHGTNHRYYGLKSAVKQNIAKEFKKKYSNLSFEELINLIDSLNEGESYEEKTIAATILFSYNNHKQKIVPTQIDKWLENLEGWAEVDSTCQSTFSSYDLFSNWEEWKKLLTEFSKSSNISRKRASLVLLTKPVRDIRDDKLREVAFENITRLKSEKDILITKAISWLLRDMIKNYREEVIRYLEDNKDSLPKIALRETTRKLKTGKK